LADKDEDDKPRNGGRRKLAVYFRYSAAGTQLFAAIGLGALLGWWLDGKFGLSPLLLICGMFFGFATGFYTLYKELFGPKR
jgi:F0F1-type ATP synthase assembly protein I